jgi:hypothetical protein
MNRPFTLPFLVVDVAIKPIAHASRTWWLSLSAWLLIGWLGLHLLGAAMTLVLELRLGFFPIWFLDCVACSAPEVSVLYGTPLVGGLSWFAVVAVLAAMVVLVRATRSIDVSVEVSSLVLMVAMAAHVIVTWPVRYPGSIPPVLVAVALPFLGVLAGAVGLFGLRRPEHLRPVHTPLSTWAVVCLASGAISMALLGGVVSVVSLGLCGWRLPKAEPGINRVMVTTGGVLAVLSGILRALLRLQFPASFSWVW